MVVNEFCGGFHYPLNVSGMGGHVSAGQESEAAGDGDYASEGSGDDDEATLEEEDAMAAQDGADRAVRYPLTHYNCMLLILNALHAWR